MSPRNTPNSARGLLYKGFKNDAELTKDISAFFAFASVATSPTPLSFATALASILQLSGSIASAATNLIERFRGPDGRQADSLEPFERFNALFLLTTIRSYMEALDALLSDEIAQLEGAKKGKSKGKNSSALSDEDRKVALEEAQKRAKEVNDSDLTYLFGVEPLGDEVPLLSALDSWLIASLVASGISAFEARALAEKCSKEARVRFRATIAESNTEAQWMRTFLALESQAVVRASIEDLGSTTAALRGWLVAQEASKGSADAWVAYKQELVSLPEKKGTMYNEDFGVSDVFQAPSVKYHVAGSKGEAGTPHEITDVGRLLGALVSTRTEGQDLIILSGGPGSGKSTLCRVFASELAQSEDTHPIFLQLRRAKEGAEISQFIEDALQRNGLIDRIAELLDLPNVVVILDGFDELVAANRSRLRQFFNVLLDEVRTGPLRNAHVVISGRDTLFPSGQGLPVGSHVLSLQPFDRSRVEAWGKRWRSKHPTGDGSTFHPERFLPSRERPVKQSAEAPLEHLVSWPLTLHLVARVHTAGGLPAPSDASIPIDKAYLYRSILAETSERQADQVTGEGRMEPDTMRSFLRSVAWLMYTESVDSLDITDVAPLLEEFGDSTDGVDPNQLAEVAVLNAPELSKGEETGFEFVHKSFSEFLAAERIAEEIEKVSFMVPEFGSQAPAWRMSDVEACTALAEVLGIRLLPAEIEEMLEPMLGAVLEFRKGRSVKDRVPLANRKSGLEAALRRTEALYKGALAGAGGFAAHEDVVKNAPGMVSVLEAQANYLVGLVLLGTAAAGQLTSDKPSTRFNAEPEQGALWRFLALSHAGGITIDQPLAKRIFPRMSVRREDETVGDVSLPWKLYLMENIDGFQSDVPPATEMALRASKFAVEMLVLLVLVLRDREGLEESTVRRLRRRSPRRAPVVWREMQFEFTRGDATIGLAYALGRAGLVHPDLAEAWLSRGRLSGGEWGDVADYLDRFAVGDPEFDARARLVELLRQRPLHESELPLARLIEEILVAWERHP